MAEDLFQDFSPVPVEDWLKKIESDFKVNDEASREKLFRKLTKSTADDLDLFAVQTERDLQDDFIPQGALPHGRHTAAWKVHHDFANPSPEKVAAIIGDPQDFTLDSLGFQLENILDSRTGGGIQAFFQQDLKTLLGGISNPETEIHLDAGSAFAPVFAALLNVLEGSGWNLKNIHGSISNDLQFIHPDALSTDRQSVEVVRKGLETTPAFKSIRIGMEQVMNAGATSAQQVAWALSLLVDNLEFYLNHGFSTDEIVSHTQVIFGLGSDFYEEIAKVRAFRFLVPEIIKGFGQSNSELQVRAKSARINQSQLDPHVNMLRGTTTAMAAVMGGYDLIGIAPYNFTSGDPDRQGHRIARNIQHLLREESYLDRVIDPARGSWYIEKYTQKIAAKAWEIFKALEKEGGYLKALHGGNIHAEIKVRQSEILNQVAHRRSVQVGANQFPLQGQKIAEAEQQSVDGLWQAADRDGHTEAGMTPETFFMLNPDLNEQVTEMTGITGEEWMQNLQDLVNQEIIPFPLLGWRLCGGGNVNIPEEMRTSRPFEENYRYFSGENPQKKQASVFLFPFGELRFRMARLGFARDLFGVFGFQVGEPQHPGDIEGGYKEAVKHNPDYVVLCASDEDYLTKGEKWMEMLKRDLPDAKLVIAGGPGGDEWEKLRARGASHQIRLGMDLLEFAEILKQEWKGGKA